MIHGSRKIPENFRKVKIDGKSETIQIIHRNPIFIDHPT